MVGREARREEGSREASSNFQLVSVPDPTNPSTDHFQYHTQEEGLELDQWVTQSVNILCD